MDNRRWKTAASGSPPNLADLASVGYPTDGNTGTGTPAAAPGAAWFHMIGEELRKVLVDAGITPDHTNTTQLSAAIQILGAGSVVSSGRIFPNNDRISYGAAVRTQSYVQVAGSFAPVDGGVYVAGVDFTPSITGTPGDNLYGAHWKPTLVEAGSGVHALIAANAFMVPTITGAAGTVTDAANVYIAGKTGATVTGGDWALWVDADNVRFDGDLVFGGTLNIRANTPDGGDSNYIGVHGGGAASRDRGAGVYVGGNESALAGRVELHLGNVAGAELQVYNSAGGTACVIAGSTGAGTFTASVDNNFAWTFTQTNAANPVGIFINYSAAAPNTADRPFWRCGDTAGTKAEIRSNGGLANFSANNVNLSDATAKEIAGFVASERDVFRRLQFVLARYRDAPVGSPLDVMVTAQNVREIYPDLVTDFSPGLLGVREHGLVMRAMRVVQELIDECDGYKARLAALEQRIH